jgi:hypothetical protein
MTTSDQPPVAPASTLREVIARYPSTGDIFVQRGRMYRMVPGSLYTSYDPPLTVEEYVRLNGLDLDQLLQVLNEAAEADARRQAPARPDAPSGEAIAKGRLGYTGGYREQPETDARPYSSRFMDDVPE